MNRIEKLKESIKFIKERGVGSTEFGIILGTGLGGLVKKIKPIVILDYKEIPHFPITTVSYHKGKLIYGTLFGKKVLVFNGRFHLYEGYDFFEITYPVRIIKLLRVKNRDYSLMKVYVLQERTTLLILNLVLEKCLMEKVLKEFFHYLVQT